MAATAPNPLISSQKSSQLHVVLHPLVLLTISDYITRHTLRQISLPIIGGLLGQQNGRETTVEHAFDCHLVEALQEEGGFLLDTHKFSQRLEQMVTVHKDRQLDFVGWFTLLPTDGPTSTVLPIHKQILQGWNESAILLGFHPEAVLANHIGGNLPITIYESNYEADDTKADNDGQDKKMDDGEPHLKLKFREASYSVESDETEMIGMNYIASGGGNAAAIAARDSQPSRSVESNGKGKRRLVESKPGDGFDVAESEDESAVVLSRDDEETLAALYTKANAIKMLQSRIDLLATYLEKLPTTATSDDRSENSMDTDQDEASPSLRVLREIKALTGRLSLVVPSDDESFRREMACEESDVETINLLSTLIQSINQARDVGRKFQIVDNARNSFRRTAAGDFVGMSFPLPDSAAQLML